MLKHEKFSVHFNITLIEIFLFVTVDIFFLDDQWHSGIIAGTTQWKLTTFLDFLIQPAMPCNILSITALSLDVDIMNSFYQSLFMWIDRLASYRVANYIRLASIEKYKYSKREKINKLRLLFVMLILKNSFLFQYNWTRDNSRKIVKNISGEHIILYHVGNRCIGSLYISLNLILNWSPKLIKCLDGRTGATRWRESWDKVWVVSPYSVRPILINIFFSV